MAQSELGRCNGVLALCLSLGTVKLPKDWREKLKKSSGFTWWFFAELLLWLRLLCPSNFKVANLFNSWLVNSKAKA